MTDDLMTCTDSPLAVVFDMKQPNLFKHDMGACNYVFSDLSLLTSQGYLPFEQLTDEIIDIFRTDELHLNGERDKFLFCKDYGTYKILLLLSTLWPVLELPDLLPSTNTPYYILAKVLLNPDNTVVKTLTEGFPSLVLFRRESRRERPRNNIIIDAYYCFCKNYYYLLDIEEFDYMVSKYYFTFRDYNNNIIAKSEHFNSNVSELKLKNSTFYINTNPYEHQVLIEIDSDLKDKPFSDLLNYKATMKKEQIALLTMLMI